jgi:hypothetical protein
MTASMTKTFQPLFSDTYLRTIYGKEYAEFRNSSIEEDLIKRLENWQGRAKNQTETQEEGAFLTTFFYNTWGYSANGTIKSGYGFTSFPKYRVSGAGQSGGTGEADLALGWFEHPSIPPTPQVLCEFKDIRSNLDARQNRKGNTRTPVKQCADYLREAGRELYGNEAIQPTWGIVTDMNEFRLYWRNRMPTQYQRFIINTTTSDDVVSLLAKTEEASFQRFLFVKLFHVDSLLTAGGDSPLLKTLHKQWILDKEIENAFYQEYRKYRKRIYETLVEYNQDFPGTKGRLVRLSQKLIDRCIFVLFCEDMGEALRFPPNALRDFLKEFSKADWYDPDAQDVWNKLKELFHAMDKGDEFRGKRINRFNGGLFAADAELDGLIIPNHVFCEKLQGENEETLKKHPSTLLYMSAMYNFGTSRSGEQAITLYTLGRIFEQSITELEVLEAEADEKVSLSKETKRKRDGVYYTPEWVVQHIVEETIGTRLQEIRDELGWSIEIEGDNDYVRKQKELSPSARAQKFNAHVEAARKYRERLNSFTVCDPACGSGVFLIHVLEYLLKERLKVSQEYARVTRQGESLFEANTEQEIREILSRNIYGVDINPSSIEITKLALWLHTAKPDQALCDLDENIRDGNSLIGPEFCNFKQLSMLDVNKQEEINVFDWKAAFSKVFDDNNPDGAGFDCIVGNPPYVKLQNFKKKYAEVADFLKEGKKADGTPVYISTQTNNFDLFLPFIERSIELLNEKGRMGFIAPSVWRMNEYGNGLRQYIHAGRHLDRWIDFGGYQVFEEAITYTALQFYSKFPNDQVKFVFANDGTIVNSPDWGDTNWSMSYKALPKSEPWVFAPMQEIRLIEKLKEKNKTLGDADVSSGIFVGIQTNANKIYHLQKIGMNKYLCFMREKNGEEVEINDEVMRPLLSGPDVKRYTEPLSDIYILFPYRVNGEKSEIIPQEEFETKFPLAWQYLKSFESDLRAREEGKINDDKKWWGWIYLKNLTKQSQARIVLAGTATKLEGVVERTCKYITNDRRVYSITSPHDDLDYLCAMINSKVCDFIFKKIARPKANGFYDIEAQFLAPLPVPKATAQQKEDVGNRAKVLQELHTKRRDKLKALEKRFEACPVKKRNEDWIFPQVGTMDHWKEKAPTDMAARDKAKWAKEQRALKIEERIQSIDTRLNPSVVFDARFIEGEMVFTVDGVAVIDKVFVNEKDGQHILTYWQHIARTTSITEKFKAQTLINKLCATPMTDNPDLAAQISTLTDEIEALDADISAREEALNDIIYDLYELTEMERKIISVS